MAELASWLNGGADLQWQTTVVVGCGGGYWHAYSGLRALLDGMKTVWFIDPDTVSAQNGIRQWPGWAGWPKPECSSRLWGVGSHAELREFSVTLQEVVAKVEAGLTLRGPALILALPDNDQTRFDSCRLAELVTGGDQLALHISAGNDERSGQAIWGVYAKGHWLYDWRQTYPEQSDASRSAHGCGGGQTLEANMLSAVCLCRAVRTAMQPPTLPHPYPTEERWCEKARVREGRSIYSYGLTAFDLRSIADDLGLLDLQEAKPCPNLQ